MPRACSRCLGRSMALLSTITDSRTRRPTCDARQSGTIMVRKCMVWYGKERETEWFIPVDRGISKESVRSGLKWVAQLPPRAMAMSGSGLLPVSMIHGPVVPGS